MEERILLCKYALTRKPIVINVTIAAADEATVNLRTDYICARVNGKKVLV